MSERTLARLRGILQFAILWLMVVYFVEAVRGAVVELGGLLVVLITSAVVTYCKWRAQRGVARPSNLASYYFWTYLPSVPAIASVLGILYKLARRQEETAAGGFWGVLWKVMPTALEFGVPIVALCWAYVILIRRTGPVEAVVTESPSPSPVVEAEAEASAGSGSP